MGKNIGTLGKYKEPTDDFFEYFGHEIRVNPDFSELDLLDFVEAGTTIDDQSPEALTMLKTFFRTLIHPDDFDLFWSVAKKNRQGFQALAEVSQGVIAGLSGLPTQSPPASSDGRPTTVGTSTVVEFSPEGNRALSQLAGRPDLQLHVVRREEARQAAIAN